MAKTVSGKQTANSGATAFYKGDIQTDLFLIECKTVTKEKTAVTIKREWLKKNKEESFAMGRPYCALAFDFGDGENYYIIDEKTFIELEKLLHDKF